MLVLRTTFAMAMAAGKPPRGIITTKDTWQPLLDAAIEAGCDSEDISDLFLYGCPVVIDTTLHGIRAVAIAA